MITFDLKTYQYKKLNDFDLSSIKETFLKDHPMGGWYDLRKDDIKEIQEVASTIRKSCEVFLVIGIGGSYMGAKAVIDAMMPYYGKKPVEVIFAGYQLSTDYLLELKEYLKDKEVMVNVISKSGTTLEPAIAFQEVLSWMEEKYGEGAKDRIFATTDAKTGTLLALAKEKGFKTFVVPDDIGGRFSVLTPVGLLPIAVAGFDIEELFIGASKAKENLEDCYYYSKLRDELYQEGKVVESFDFYEPKLASFAEWLKQLFGESQGKEGKGILPVSTINTRDLHSLGQYYQEGKDILFSTCIFAHSNQSLYLEEYHKTLDEVNELAMESVAQAHYEGHLPTSIIRMDKISLENLGYLIFFFEMSAMLGGYLLNIRYYDQPGVNGYKDILHKKIKEDR